MSATVISLAAYRTTRGIANFAPGMRPEPGAKKHAPKCRACRQPGHYAPACPDDEARSRYYEAQATANKARMSALLASFEERGIR